VGFQDETWWSRLAQPGLAAWTAERRPLRLVEVAVPRPEGTREPKALACYGLWLPEREEIRLRCVDGRPVSALTAQFLAWCAAEAQPLDGSTTLILIWDNANWHLRRPVRAWLRAHNQAVQRAGQGVKLVPCSLPSKHPWLNSIEPKWQYVKRCLVEPERSLSLEEVEERVCQVFDCPHLDHLSLSNDAA
jgi:hypothetical protein